MAISVFRKAVALVFSVLLLLSASRAAFAENKEQAPGDLQHSWADGTLQEWWTKGWIHGYPDGTFRPDSNISRAEFISLVIRALGLSAQGDLSFRDIGKNDWAYEAVAIAYRAGYVKGYEDGTIRPHQDVSREEVAVMVHTMLQLEGSKNGVSPFRDASSFADWSQAAIDGLAAAGVLSGYPDGMFHPGNKITRAEAVVALNNAMRYAATERTRTYAQPGAFGSASGLPSIVGNVVVGSPGVTLQNMLILGDLSVQGTGTSGEVILKNVVVHGKTSISGVASQVGVIDSTLGYLNVCTTGGSVRITAAGHTQVAQTTLCSSATLEEKDLAGDGFREVILSADMTKGSIAELRGTFDNVAVNASGVTLKLEQGSIRNAVFGPGSNGSSGQVAPTASIDQLVLDTAVSVSGQGEIERATLNPGAGGTTFERKPNRIDGAEGSGAAVAPPDTSPPLFGSGYPKWLAGSETSALVVVKANEPGRLYAVAALPGNPPPNSLQVKAGQLGNGIPAVSAGLSVLTANTDTAIPLTGLTAGTDYTLYVVAEDHAGNIQAVPAAGIVKTSGLAPLKFGTASLPNGKVGATYAPVMIESSGGVGKRIYSLVSGALPVGMAFSSSGIFSGAPTVAGSYTFTVRVTDDQPANANQSFTVVIEPPDPLKFGTTSLPNGKVGAAYTPVTIESFGGIGKRTYSLVSGALPVGMALTSSGVFSGAPTVAGSYTFTLRVTDDQPANANQSFTVVIEPPEPLKFGTTSLPNGKVGAAYTPVTIESFGGFGKHTYSLVSGALPVGMALTSSGSFSGSPTVAGSYTFTVRVTDDQPATANQSFTVVIEPPEPLKFGTTSLPSGKVGVTYAPVTIESSGG
ncbi:S-layer homology domain-containing protein, partial [Paenibacillus ginsengarvi]